MNRFRLVLCLTLLVSSLGSAQTEEEEWSPYTPTQPAPALPPPLVPADPPAPPVAPVAPQSSEASDESSELSEPRGELIPRELRPKGPRTESTALRLVGGPFAGIIGSFGGAMAGAIIGGVVLLPFCVGALQDRDPNNGCLVGLVALGSIGATLGATGTVYLVGEMFGGRGRFLPSLLGGLVGTTLGAVSGTVSENTLVLVLGLGIGPIIGSVIGYEVSHSLEPAVVPIISATPRGGFLGGLAVRF